VTIVTESGLRARLRQPRTGARVTVPRGATLSPSARDFVAHWGLDVVETDDAQVAPTGSTVEWDRPTTFPVVVGGEAPRCVTCGGTVTDKPDRLTQLDACHLAPKTVPRIRLRGRLDSLQALALLAAARATACGSPNLAGHLGSIAAYCRELLSAEYNQRPAAPPRIGGRDEATAHAATHDPRGAFGIDHLTPGPDDPEPLLWCNHLRCQIREVEVVALDAFPSPHHEAGASVVHGLNRLSSAVYDLELQLVAAGGRW
jgi:ethanolamine utilization cobalamin adenosyltransferase